MQLDPFSNVTSSPFKMTFPLREALAHASWERARLKIMDIAMQGNRVVLVGEPGTGKSLLLQDLDRCLRQRGLGVRKFRIGDPLRGLAESDVLLIDEADLFATDELERICHLPNALIMTGLPSFIERLPECSHPFHCERLEPLQAEDIARFVRLRLATSDRAHPSFTPEAILALERQSAGLFRLVTILAGAAGFFAQQRGSSEITASDVDNAASLRASAFESIEAETLPDVATVLPVSDQASARVHALSVVQADSSLAAAPRWEARRRMVAGRTGWFCASLGVVIVAIMAAHILTDSRSALQEAERRPLPVLAAAVEPEPSRESRVPIVQRSPAQLVKPPIPVVASLPSPLEPTARPEAVLAEADPPPPHRALSESRPLVPFDAERPHSVVAFGGQIINETMGQGGQLSLKLVTSSAGGPVGALFHASNGLIGTGMLNGAIGPSGRLSLTGRLMMGRNPFDCTLHATLEGDRLVGEATFVRQTTGSVARSRFSLSKL